MILDNRKWVSIQPSQLSYNYVFSHFVTHTNEAIWALSIFPHANPVELNGPSPKLLFRNTDAQCSLPESVYENFDGM